MLVLVVVLVGVVVLVVVVTLAVIHQALLQKEEEKAALEERNQNLEQDLVSASRNLQHTQREAQSRLEKAKVTPSEYSHTPSIDPQFILCSHVTTMAARPMEPCLSCVSEAKQVWAWLVLGWETNWEH